MLRIRQERQVVNSEPYEKEKDKKTRTRKLPHLKILNCILFIQLSKQKQSHILKPSILVLKHSMNYEKKKLPFAFWDDLSSFCSGACCSRNCWIVLQYWSPPASQVSICMPVGKSTKRHWLFRAAALAYSICICDGGTISSCNPERKRIGCLICNEMFIKGDAQTHESSQTHT